MTEELKPCEMCGANFHFCWTDSHGVGQCVTCGAPYRIYHYDDKERIEKPPELLLDGEHLEDAKAFWLETNKRLSSHSMGLSFTGNRSYDVATAEEAEAWVEWHKKRIDAQMTKEAGSNG